MTLGSLKISKTFKTHYCQQHWLDLEKVVTPHKKMKKNPSLLSTILHQFAPKKIKK